MTCIVGLVQSGSIWMGADSAGVGGWSLRQRTDEKAFLNGSFVFGFTSSFRMGQLLKYRFIPPEVPGSMAGDIDRYMTTLFIDGIRSCLREYAFTTVQNSVEKGGTFLVGFSGNLYSVEDDFQVGQSVHPFDAVGCGADLALGSMYSTMESDKSPDDRIRLALSAAEAFSAGVRGPFNVVRLQPSVPDTV